MTRLVLGVTALAVLAGMAVSGCGSAAAEPSGGVTGADAAAGRPADRAGWSAAGYRTPRRTPGT